MTVTVRKRAISEEQKQARRNAVILAASELFLETGFFDVSMSMIAKRAGVAKGTIYIYFETKEEIFLSLLLDELKVWFEQLEDELSVHEEPLNNVQFVEIFRRNFEHRLKMVRLISLMHMVLEKNVSYEQVLAFKRGLIALMLKVSPMIEKALPYLPEGGGNQILIEFHSQLIGWSNITETSPVLERVHEHPEIQGLRFELQDALFNSFSLLLDGLKMRYSA
jgi:AcrR family transcriptional regulator